MSTERKSYTEEFKREAVRLAKERGNVAATARGLGISNTSLENWKRHLEQTPGNFQDLPFDISKHTEALESFEALNLLPHSIKPALRARDLIFVRVPSCKFRIGVTGDPDAQASIEKSAGSVAFEVIYQADDPIEAEQVRGDVERYFLRHYPGRILRHANESTEGIFIGNHVYVACHTPRD